MTIVAVQLQSLHIEPRVEGSPMTTLVAELCLGRSPSQRLCVIFELAGVREERLDPQIVHVHGRAPAHVPDKRFLSESDLG